MSDDIQSKIQQLKDMLSNNQLPENMKAIMELMTSKSSPTPENQAPDSALDIINDNQAMIRKIMKIMDKKKEISDPRVNLLNSIKPYLGVNRQKRIDSFTKMLSFIQLSSLIKDED